MVGRLLDRYGSRLFIVAAAAVIGLCLLAISQVNEAWQFFVLFGVIGVTGVTAPNSLVTSVPVAKWFVRLRGRALALSTLGLGVGGVTLVPLTQFLIDEEGWRAAWGIMAIAFMVICIPVAALFLRRQPEDMGLEVDGGPRSAGSRPISNTSAARRIAASEEDAWTLADARRESTLWKLMVVFALHGLAQGGSQRTSVPLLDRAGHRRPDGLICLLRGRSRSDGNDSPVRLVGGAVSRQVSWGGRFHRFRLVHDPDGVRHTGVAHVRVDSNIRFVCRRVHDCADLHDGGILRQGLSSAPYGASCFR